MNATCQVTQLSPGRIRLHISNMATQPEVYHRLVQFVLSLPEVTRVELEPGESLTIIHTRTPQARAAILQALRGGTGAKTSAAKPAPRASAPATRPVQFPYADCAVAHAMKGRVRLRVPILRTDRTLAGVLEYHVRQQAGVMDVTLNRLSEGITIAYDAAMTDAQALVKLIAAYEPDAAAVARWQSSQVRPQRKRVRRIGYVIAIALAALAAVLSFYDVSSVIVLGLLFVSSLPIFRRGIQILFKQSRASLPLAAAAVITVMGLLGMIWQAAVFIIVLALVDWIHSGPHKSVDNALANALSYANNYASVRRTTRRIAAPARAAKTANPRQSLPLQKAASPGPIPATLVSKTGSVSDDQPPQVPATPEVESLSERSL